jgi:hypothetical protein
MLLKFLTEEQHNALSAICYELEKKYPGITEFIDQMINNDESVLDLQLFLITDSIYHEYTFDLGLILEKNEKYINKWNQKFKSNEKFKIQESLGTIEIHEIHEIHTHSLKKPIRLFWKLVDPVKFKLVPVKNKIKCKLVSLKNKIWKI